jgi:hypothetical protein
MYFIPKEYIYIYIMTECKGRMLRNIPGPRGAEVARRSRKLEDDLVAFFVIF